MRRGAISFGVAGALLTTAGCAGHTELSIRAKPTGLAAGAQPVSFRVAEARGQLALGNVALASEGFRKALREDPASVDAMNGLAVCYDRMGRFDLSRRYYESALAVAPGDARLYANLAVSLDLQGKTGEAAAIRAEMAARLSAGRTATAALLDQVPGQATGASSGPAPSPASLGRNERSVSAAAASSLSARLVPVERARADGPRLERLSMGEVALVTAGPVRWASRPAEPGLGTAAAAAYRNSRPTTQVTLLNAARTAGLAARTRALLQRRGWTGIAIGDASAVQGTSSIIYPDGSRAEAVRIASLSGLPLRHRPGRSDRLVIYLGRDAARLVGRGG